MYSWFCNHKRQIIIQWDLKNFTCTVIVLSSFINSWFPACTTSLSIFLPLLQSPGTLWKGFWMNSPFKNFVRKIKSWSWVSEGSWDGFCTWRYDIANSKRLAFAESLDTLNIAIRIKKSSTDLTTWITSILTKRPLIVGLKDLQDTKFFNFLRCFRPMGYLLEKSFPHDQSIGKSAFRLHGEKFISPEHVEWPRVCMKVSRKCHPD